MAPNLLSFLRPRRSADVESTRGGGTAVVGARTRALRRHAVVTPLDKIWLLLNRAKRVRPPADFKAVQQRIANGYGVEIGGPSRVFQKWHLWPIYPVVREIDLCDYAAATIWGDDRATTRGGPWKRRGPFGRRIVAEAGHLSDMPADAYDFLLASHVLEHLANPLAALKAWGRVVRGGGLIVLVVPHRDGTFDHRRPVTTFQHLLDDATNGTTEGDLTHLDEILRLHDLSRDPGASGRAAFELRAHANASVRSLHHHVFDTELVLWLVEAAGFRIAYVDVQRPYHICVVCEVAKSLAGRSPAMLASASENANSHEQLMADIRRRSPFPSDRLHHARPIAASRPL